MGALRPEYVRLVLLQGAITIIGAVFTYWINTPLAAKSLVYGSCVALISTAFLAWRFKQGRGDMSAEGILRQAYRTAIERFVWVMLMLGLGFKILEFAPLWMLAGFVVGQAAWLLTPIWMKFENAK